MPGGLENIIKVLPRGEYQFHRVDGGDLEAYLGAPENPMMKFFRQQAPQPAAKPGEKPAAPRRMGPRSLLRSSRLRSINIRKR